MAKPLLGRSDRLGPVGMPATEDSREMGGFASTAAGGGLLPPRGEAPSLGEAGADDAGVAMAAIAGVLDMGGGGLAQSLLRLVNTAL